MRIEFLEQNKHLDEVTELGNKHSKTLGFMREGIFTQHAKEITDNHSKIHKHIMHIKTLKFFLKNYY